MACQYGSQVKAGVTSRWEWVTGRAMADAAGIFSQYFAAPVINALFPSLVDLQVMCAAPPPPLPTIDLLALALAGQLPLLPQIVVDWLLANWKRANWNTFCECKLPPPPVGTGPVTCTGHGSIYPCWVACVTPVPNAFDYFGEVLVNDQDYKGDDGYSIVTNPPALGNCAANPVENWGEVARWFGLGEPGSSGYPQHIASTETGGPYYFVLLISDTGDNDLDTSDKTTTFRVTPVSGPPPTPYVPPALPPPPESPPPPSTAPTACTLDDVCAAVDAVQKMLGPLTAEVTRIQRYRLPFSFAPKTVHAGATNTGSFPISRLIGVKAHVTESPDPGRLLEGNPPYVWNLGWLAVTRPDGLVEEKRLAALDLTWFPQLCELATTFSYFLFPGVTVTFTELAPEE